MPLSATPAAKDLAAILEAAGSMLITWDLTGTVRVFNPAAERLLGWKAAEVVGQHTPQLWHDPDEIVRRAAELSEELGRTISPDFEVFIAKAPKTGGELREWTFIRKDGTRVPVQLVITAIRDAEHAITGYLGTAQDISQRVRAEQERDRLFDLSLDILCVAGNDGYFKRVNPAFSRILGWSEKELIGRPFLELVHPDDRQKTQQEIDQLKAGQQSLTLENRYRCKDNSWRILSWTGVPQPDGLVFATARDVTDLRRAEEELRQSHQDLERRVAERTQELAKEQRRLRNGSLVLESVVSDATFSETLELIVRFVTEEDAATRCGILLFDEQSQHLQLGAQRDLPEDFDQTLLQHPHGTQINWIWQAVLAGERVVVEDLSHTQWGEGLCKSASSIEWASAWAEPIVAADGKVLGVFVTFREQIGPPSDDAVACVECACGLARVAIERTHARAALESSEKRYRTLLEHIPAPLFVYDRDSLAYLTVSDQAVAEYGYSREEFMQMTISDIRPAGDVPMLHSMLAKSGMSFEHRGIWRHQKKGGAIIDVEITTHGFELDGRPACIVLASDITERLRAENALRRSEILNQAILQSSLDCIVTMNEAGEIVEFNRAAEQAFGYSQAQAAGRSMKDLMIPTGLREEHERGLARYLATGENHILCRRIRTTALRRDGETFPVELTVVPVEVGGERHFTAFLRDMTAALRAEQELQRTTGLLQAVADGTTDAVYVKDRQGRYLLFNQAAAKLTGHSVDEVLGKDDIFIFGDQHGRMVMETDSLVMQSNQPHTVEDELTAAGITRCYHAMKAPLRDTQGNVVGLIGISRDITERKRMEFSLRASEERYRSIVEHSPDVIFVNRDNRISFINRTGVDLLRASAADEVLGRSPLEFFHVDDHSTIQDRIAQMLAAPGAVPVNEERMIALDGTIIDVDVQAASYYSDGKLEIQVVCRDVTVRKSAQRDLQRHVRHAEFSAAIGLALSHSPTLPEMLQSCAEAMVAHLDAGFARVWTLNEQEGVLELQASAGADTRLDGTQARVPVGQKKIGRIASTKLSHFTNSVYDDPQIGDRQWAQDQGFTSFAGYPLLIEGRCVGVVAMFAREALEQDTLEYLAMAANGIAQNIKRKQSEAMLADLNTTLEQRVRERTLALAQSEQFNRATLDALSAHIAVVDPDGNIVATNAQWRNFAVENQGDYQYVSEGTNYLAVCDAAAQRGDTDAKIVADALREVLAGKRSAWQHEYPCHSPNEERWFICQVTLGHIRQQPHAVVAHENVTSIKRVQEELREAKEKAIQASLAKSEFLATMSHELRTPLNGILGMNTLMLRTDLDERQRRFAEACQSSGKLLMQLINDVLDVSKIEAGKLELDPRQCEIEAVVYDVVDIFANTAQQKGLILKCQLSQSACVSALADDNRLRQILVNLVGNAIKFTSSGGVSIVGDHVKDAAGQSRLRIEVTDSGIGIPHERINRLFKAFSQIDSSTTRQFGGTGLGLSICEQLVALMDGEIGVESQIGVGSTFWFEIPLQIIQPDKAVRRSIKGNQVSKVQPSDVVQPVSPQEKLVGHLLVAEDNPINQLYVVELLKTLGCTCDVVVNGEEVLSVLERGRYDLVLMDCQMPEMDGFTAAREIRKRESSAIPPKHIPIVALTANALKGDRERCLEAGMDDYLKKPIDGGQLRAALQKFLTPTQPTKPAAGIAR